MTVTYVDNLTNGQILLRPKNIKPAFPKSVSQSNKFVSHRYTNCINEALYMESK